LGLTYTSGCAWYFFSLNETNAHYAEGHDPAEMTRGGTWYSRFGLADKTLYEMLVFS